jgi:hypothetical protein
VRQINPTGFTACEILGVVYVYTPPFFRTVYLSIALLLNSVDGISGVRQIANISLSLSTPEYEETHVDPATAILLEIGVEYLNIEIIGRSHIEAWISEKAMSAENDVVFIHSWCWRESTQNWVLVLGYQLSDSRNVPLDVQTRQFQSVAKVLG